MFTPYRKGGSVFGAEQTPGLRSHCNHNQSVGKISPKPFVCVCVCVCGELVSIGLTLKLKVSNLIRSVGRFRTTIFGIPKPRR